MTLSPAAHDLATSLLKLAFQLGVEVSSQAHSYVCCPGTRIWQTKSPKHVISTAKAYPVINISRSLVVKFDCSLDNVIGAL